MRLYISGPMTSYPGENRAAFARAAAWLRTEGHDVVSPAEIITAPGAAWGDCLRADIAALVTCDAIALLQGWPQSRGARAELSLALDLGLEVYAVLDDALVDLNADPQAVTRHDVIQA